MVAVTDKAIEKLKVMISSGELRPGQRLPRNRTWPPAWGCPGARCERRYALCR